MRRTLYEITADLIALDDLLTETGGDISDEAAAAAIDSWLALLGGERDDKLDGYCWLIREIEARGEARKAESARLAALASTDTNATKRLKERMMLMMELTGTPKIETKHFKIGVCANGGKQPVELRPEVQANPAMLPPNYQRVKIEADTDAIREALEAGETLTFAELKPRGKHVRLR